MGPVPTTKVAVKKRASRDGAYEATGAGRVDPESILASIATVVIVVGPNNDILYVNTASEQFFDASAPHLQGMMLTDLIPVDNPLFSIIKQALDGGAAVSEYGVTLESPRIGRRDVNVQAMPMAENASQIIVSIHQRNLADKIARQLDFRGAARSVTGLAAMLAHEVKNPLSGIRGAAQLLEQDVNEDDKSLTRLICDETDRICALVDRMAVFNEGRALQAEPVNIHRVLEHVRKIAQNGFAKNIRFVERYDPSLPPVAGNRDQLVQILLNLVKNAAEAAPDHGGKIILTTSYKHGLRLAVPGSGTRVHLPLVVSVRDNGAGIPDDIKPYLFEPFISGKSTGTGLGLALVAKITGDHGGVIEYDSAPGRTEFRLALPIAKTNQDFEKTENVGPHNE